MTEVIDTDTGKTEANGLHHRDVHRHEVRLIAGNENRVRTVLGNVNYNILALDRKDLLQLTNSRGQDESPLSIFNGVKGLLSAFQKQIGGMQDSIAESDNEICTQSFKIFRDKLEATITRINEQIQRFDKLDNENWKQNADLGGHKDVVGPTQKTQSGLESTKEASTSNNLKEQMDSHVTRRSENDSIPISKHRKAPAPPKYFSIRRALYDFQAVGDDELSLMEGDTLAVIDESMDLTQDGWCKARLRGTSHTGFVPISYLEPAEALRRCRS